jgi:hypothetical protein
MDLAEILVRLPAPPRERIESELERVRELIDATGARVFLPRIHEVRARLDPEARERELRSALGLYEAMQSSAHAARIAQELA